MSLLLQTSDIAKLNRLSPDDSNNMLATKIIITLKQSENIRSLDKTNILLYALNIIQLIETYPLIAQTDKGVIVKLCINKLIEDDTELTNEQKLEYEELSNLLIPTFVDILYSVATKTINIFREEEQKCANFCFNKNNKNDVKDKDNKDNKDKNQNDKDNKDKISK